MTSEIILAFDTTGMQDSIAIGLGDGIHDPIDTLYLPQGGSQRQSAYLISDLKDLLSKHNLQLADVTMLCTLTGPGSFTGIRIGLAALQGLRMGIQCPIFTPSTLNTLLYHAQTLDKHENIMAIIDSKRGDYFGQKLLSGSPEIYDLEAIENFVQKGGKLISSSDLQLSIPHGVTNNPLAKVLIEFYRSFKQSGAPLSTYNSLLPTYIRNPEFKKKH